MPFELWARFQVLRTEWGLMVDLLLVLLAVFAINAVIKRLFAWLAGRVDESENVWDDALYHSLSAPLRTAVWVAGLSIAIHVAGLPWTGALAETLSDAQLLASVVIVAWFLCRLIAAVEANLIRRSIRAGEPLDQTTADAIAKLLRLVVMTCAAVAALHALGVSIAGVLAFGGLGGVVLGFAAKDVLANLLGGVTIYLNRPFSVGDWIRSPDRDIEGTVEAIGWRATTVRRFDKRPLYVPNAVFATVALENATRMTHRRIFETIGVRYQDAAVLVPILADIRQMLVENEEIDSNQLILVYFDNFGASSLDFFLYCFTVTREWARSLEVKQAVLIGCQDIIADYGAEVAFPTRTLHLPAGLESARREHAGGAGAASVQSAPAGGRDTSIRTGSIKQDG